MKVMDANALRGINGGYFVSVVKKCHGCGGEHYRGYAYKFFWQKSLWQYRATLQVDDDIRKCVNSRWFR